MSKRIVIVGGVAGGASAAARARRLSETAEIHIIERGSHVSFANCGLPYHIGGEIQERSKILLHTPESLATRFNLQVHTNCTATSIDRAQQLLKVRPATGNEFDLEYDNLILAPGAAPLKPPVAGLEGPGVFTLRDVSDMDAILQWIDKQRPKHALVVGGGFIGIEVAEQLKERLEHVTLFEGKEQVLAPFDSELAGIIAKELSSHIDLALGSRFTKIERDEHGRPAGIVLENGKTYDGDLIILGLGVRPEAQLAKEADLEIGERGGIRVNEYLQTSDTSIYAVGDAIEVRHIVTGEWSLIPLAGPANRQGRMAADNILLPNKKSYRGTLGTAVLRVFSKIAACTGVNEATLKRLALPYEKLYVFPKSHAGYFPGAKTIAMKVLFNPETRRLLGAQAIGEDGVEKRIDVLATALLADMSIDDIAELELSYAPPVGSAKDPVNIAGMAMQNIADGLVKVVGPDALTEVILDVRGNSEVAHGMIPNAIHIPLDELRDRHEELPHNQTISVYCHSGLRSYNATRILTQLGYDAVNVTGAWSAYQLFE